MNPIVKIYKRIKIGAFNRKYGTNIKSYNASLKAKYGQAVRVDSDVRVAGDVTIGDYSYVNHDSSLQNCDIGKYCSISSNVNICPYNHNMKGITTHPIGDVQRTIKRVTIGNDVLISLNVVILEGVHIGDGAVIGAGAVVTHDVGKYEVWGGVPAKFIHHRVPDETQRDALSKLQWWNFDDEKVQRTVEKYRNSLSGIECDQ